MISLMELIRGVILSSRCALAGLAYAFRTQRNLRIHLTTAVGVVTAGLILRFNRAEVVLLVLTISIVLMGELLNTSVELLLNLLESRDHPVVRVAKDVAAGAVLMTILGAVGVGLILFGPHLCAAISCSRCFLGP